LNPTVPPSSLILLITSSNKMGLKSVCSTQTQW